VMHLIGPLEEITLDQAPAQALWLSPEIVQRLTGWALRPEGLCLGSQCVPLPAGKETEYVNAKEVCLSAFWQWMNKPLAKSDEGDVWCLGEGADVNNERLASLRAPDFTLPDFSGQLHSLTDFRRQRVLLITWASW